MTWSLCTGFEFNPLSEVAETIRYIEQGLARGKTVINML